MKCLLNVYDVSTGPEINNFIIEATDASDLADKAKSVLSSQFNYDKLRGEAREKFNNIDKISDLIKYCADDNVIVGCVWLQDLDIKLEEKKNIEKVELTFHSLEKIWFSQEITLPKYALGKYTGEEIVDMLVEGTLDDNIPEAELGNIESCIECDSEYVNPIENEGHCTLELIENESGNTIYNNTHKEYKSLFERPLYVKLNYDEWKKWEDLDFFKIVSEIRENIAYIRIDHYERILSWQK